MQNKLTDMSFHGVILWFSSVKMVQLHLVAFLTNVLYCFIIIIIVVVVAVVTKTNGCIQESNE